MTRHPSTDKQQASHCTLLPSVTQRPEDRPPFSSERPGRAGRVDRSDSPPPFFLLFQRSRPPRRVGQGCSSLQGHSQREGRRTVGRRGLGLSVRGRHRNQTETMTDDNSGERERARLRRRRRHSARARASALLALPRPRRASAARNFPGGQGRDGGSGAGLGARAC